MKKSVAIGFAFLVVLACDFKQDAELERSAQPKKIEGRHAYALLPEKNVLPITAASFCQGIKNVKAITKQNFDEEIALICDGDNPTPLFDELIANPFAGENNPELNVLDKEDLGDNKIQLRVVYSLRIPKGPVPLLLGEEPMVANSAYDNDGFKISFKFVTPPPNDGDADTGFELEQYSSHEGNGVDFEDTSKHTLKLYRLHPGNFDFFLAARTLIEKSEQFFHSVALRGAMPDPANPDQALSITVMNLIMNGRDNEDNVLDIVEEYLQDDMEQVYNYHTEN